jgi:hypothetical protein
LTGYGGEECSYEANPSLGAWVSLQRRTRKDDKVGQMRAERLDSLGFVWEGKSAREARDRMTAQGAAPAASSIPKAPAASPPSPPPSPPPRPAASPRARRKAP